MKIETLVKKAQEAMNAKGAGLVVDGQWGKKSDAASEAFELKIEAIPDDLTPPVEPTVHVDGIVEPTVVVVKGVKFKDRGDYKTPSGKFKGMTVHYAVSGKKASSARGIINYLASQGFGCAAMDEDGIIYVPENFDMFRTWGYHSGVSKWKGRSSVSDVNFGLEMCSWGRNPPSSVPKSDTRTVTTAQGYIVAGTYEKYTEKQEASLINLILWFKKNNKEFDLDYIAGHDELRKEAGKLGDKQDPGGSLSLTMPQLRALVKTKAAKLGL
jgi:hypothetical protein